MLHSANAWLHELVCLLEHLSIWWDSGGHTFRDLKLELSNWRVKMFSTWSQTLPVPGSTDISDITFHIDNVGQLDSVTHSVTHNA